MDGEDGDWLTFQVRRSLQPPRRLMGASFVAPPQTPPEDIGSFGGLSPREAVNRLLARHAVRLDVNKHTKRLTGTRTRTGQ